MGKKLFKRFRFPRWRSYINGGRGVVSILLAALMIPFVLQADVLIEVSRYHAAVSALDQIMDLASNSTLAHYDSYLMDRFGLPAVSQSIDLTGTYSDYYNSNTKGSLNAWKTQKITVKGQYPLGDNDVLKQSILETSKFSVPTQVACDVFANSLEYILGDMDCMKSINAVADATGKVANAVGSTADAAAAMENLAAAAQEVEDAKSQYTSAFNRFKSETEGYAASLRDVASKQAAKNQADEVMRRADGESSNASKRVQKKKKELSDLKDDYKDDKISKDAFESQKKALEAEIKDLEKDKSSKDDNQSSAKRQASEAQNALEKAKRNAENQKNAAISARDNYAAKILEVKGALDTYTEKASAATSSLGSVASNLNSAVIGIRDAGNTVTSQKISNHSSSLEKENDSLKHKLYDFSDTGGGEELQRQIDANKAIIDENSKKKEDLAKAKTAMDNRSTALGAGISGLQAELETGLEEYNQEVVGKCTQDLDNLHTLVSAFDVNSITGSFSCSRSTYYIEISGYATKVQIENALARANGLLEDKDEEGSDSGISFWPLAQGLSNTMNGLLKINIFYDHKLDAVIKSDLMPDEAGGISGLVNALCDAANDIKSLSDKKEMKKKSFREKLELIGKLLKDAWNALKELISYAFYTISQIKTVANKLSNGAYDNLLLAQYLNLSAANRCTYTGSDVLTGYSFRSAGMKATNDKWNSLFAVGAFSALRGLAHAHGGSSNMFRGAEGEYLVTGSRVEIMNQAAVFLRIYILRFVLDFIPVLANSDVNTIIEAATTASAALGGIGGWLVAILYILIEPFIDALVLVNGSDIDLFKHCVYLVPTGIPTLIGHLTTIGLNEDQKEEVMASTSSAMKVNYTHGTKSKKDAGSFLKAGYSEYMLLFLMMNENDTLLKRFQCLVELEAKNHYGSGFNIHNSYTYLETKVDGRYTPFLSAAEIITGLVFPRSRTQRRGY